MKIQTMFKGFAIILMAIVLLVLASWASTMWTRGMDFLGGLLPAGNEPIAVTLRGYLPTVKSVGGIAVLVVAAFLGWSFGRRIWTA